MRHTKQVNLDIGGAVLITFDSREKDFEATLGQELLQAGDIQ